MIRKDVDPIDWTEFVHCGACGVWLTSDAPVTLTTCPVCGAALEAELSEPEAEACKVCGDEEGK